LLAGSWLIDLDLRKKKRVVGVSQVPTPELRLKGGGGYDLAITIPKALEIGSPARSIQFAQTVA
jgi:hypothetical protein